MSTVISVDHISKVYRLGTLGSASLHEDVSDWWARIRNRGAIPSTRSRSNRPRQIGRQFWALDDVSFKVSEGEVLGIVGRNGAGKSTLLKILSQITAPTAGQIRIRGRIASLLEVGTGFHPDLTGRDNVFLNGAILGMTKAEIRRKFDEIVAFSECEQFIDTPVKRYSSGMYVRLAFAVAAHMSPEILIIDEVLAVGDAQFQRKCLGKIGASSRSGRTVLFVSHNMVAVQSLCQRAVLMNDGRVALEGSAASVVTEYLRSATHFSDAIEWSTPDEAPGNSALRVKTVRVSGDDPSDGLIRMTSPIQIDTSFWILQSNPSLHLTYHLVNEHDIVVLTTSCPGERRPIGQYQASFRIPGGLLNSGRYRLKLLIVENGNRVTYEHQHLTTFSVVDISERNQACLGREPGVVQPHLPWRVTALDSESLSTESPCPVAS